MNTTGHDYIHSILDLFEDTAIGSSALKISSIINLLLGIPTNCYVLWLIKSGAGGTIASEFFALNLSVSDIMSTVSDMLYLILPNQDSFPVVQLFSFFVGVFYAARPLFQACICLERYLAVVHPVVFLRYKPLRYRLACCGLVWIVIILFSACYAFINSSLSLLRVFLVLYLVVLLVHLFCCLSVLRALKRPGPGEGERGSDIKRRAFKIILLILIAMLVMYLPFIMTLLVQDVLCVGCFYFALNICVSITTVCGGIQPLLYLYRVGKCPCLNLVF